MLFQHRRMAGLASGILPPLVTSVVGVLATRTRGEGSAQGSVSPAPRALQKAVVGKVLFEAPRGLYASVHFTVDLWHGDWAGGHVFREGNGQLGCVPWKGFAPEPRPRWSLDKREDWKGGPPGVGGGGAMSRDRLGQVLVWWPVKRVLDDRCEGGVTCPLTPVKATVLLRHTCVCVRTHTHAHVHTCTQTHTETCTHTCACTHTHAHRHTERHTHTFTRTRACTHTRTHSHTRTHMHTCTCTHTHTERHAHTFMHTRACTHIHTYTHALTCTHTQESCL